MQIVVLMEFTLMTFTNSICRPTRIDIFDTIYFWFFMAYLITRTFLVLYLPSMINEAAYIPLRYIRQVPHEKWNSDVNSWGVVHK
jgi:hypothetical protein